MLEAFGPISWLIDILRGSHQRRRKIQVLVHRASFLDGRGPYYFVKATNLSPTRETVITHVWFAANPRVDLLLPERRLPARLKPDETWEGWVEEEALGHSSNVERLARVRLANGQVVKSRPNKGIPPVGYVAGGGSP